MLYSLLPKWPVLILEFLASPPGIFIIPPNKIVSRGGVCDQKTSKFFGSNQEEAMAGHVGVNGIY
jgi:hypothetical protein